MTSADATAGEELPALTRLVFDELGGAVGGIRSVQHAIAGRVFAAVGPAGRPAELGHEAISTAAYGAVRGSFIVGGRAGAALLRLRGGRAPLSTTARGAALLGALSGLIGDELERDGSPLAQPAKVTAHGRPVALNPESVAAAFPAASGHIVVFLHGVMCTEHAWGLGATRGGGEYGSRLARELGVTPVYVRYNSGRHISQNGRSLADLLEELAGAWPVEVEQISLVGHSMGGLVARSAAHQAAGADLSWVRDVRRIVSLGTPHTGAPLAQAVHHAGSALSALPETRPFGTLLRRRSAGIRDLRSGSLVDEDWGGLHPDALGSAACREIPLLEGATHCFVAATITRSAAHPVGRLLGDALVLAPSASGRSRTRRIPFDRGAQVGPLHHLALLNHPNVYEHLREWLAATP